LAGLRRAAQAWESLGVTAFDSWALALAGPSVLALLTVPEADPFGLQLRLAPGEFGGYWGDDCVIWDDYAPGAPGYINVRDPDATPEDMARHAAKWISAQLSRPLSLEERRSSAWGRRRRTWVFGDTGERVPCCRSCRRPAAPGTRPGRGETVVTPLRGAVAT
ncbi:MAG: hypothetical protein HOV83_21260, partial [Catenulispora sp.]|nr:hypothetical protein [Catenulispora sp.]